MLQYSCLADFLTRVSSGTLSFLPLVPVASHLKRNILSLLLLKDVEVPATKRGDMDINAMANCCAVPC